MVAVALNPKGNTLSKRTFVRIELKHGVASVNLDEPFVHPEYLSTITSSHVLRVQVQGEWFTTGGVNECGRIASAENICKLLAEQLSEEEFLAAAEGETVAEKLARLEKDHGRLEANLAKAQELFEGALRERDRLVTRLNRIAQEGVSLPNTKHYRRTAGDWLGDSDTPNCVSEQLMQAWLTSMVPAYELAARTRLLAHMRSDMLSTIVNVANLREVAKYSLPVTKIAWKDKERALRRSREKLLDLAAYVDPQTVASAVNEIIENLRAE